MRKQISKGYGYRVRVYAYAAIVLQAFRIFPRAHARGKGGGGREGLGPKRNVIILVSIMGERERTQEYGNEIHCHVYTSFKKTQPYLVIYNVMYNITISEKHIAQ